MVETRIHESAKQIKAIKEGIQYVIPLNVVKLLNWRQIEVRATGSKSIEIDKLKAVTVYEVRLHCSNTYDMGRTGARQMNTCRYSGE